jgi:hypothetical protein
MNHWNQAQKDALAAKRLKKLDAKAPTVLTVEDELKATIKTLETTKAALKATRTALGRQKSLQDDLMSTQAQLQSSQKAHQGLYDTLCNEHCRGQRTTHTKLLKLAELSSAQGDAMRAIALLVEANSENDHLKNELSSLLEQCAIEGQNTKTKIETLEVTLADTRHKAWIYERQNGCMPDIKKPAVKRTNKENQTHKLLHKGVYSPVSQELAQVLTKAGCSREYVGNIISMVCKSAGVEVQGKMSWGTVDCAILEGGIADKIQLGHEILETKSKYFCILCVCCIITY